MANVLVIGASGQIGKQATVKLLDAGHKVLAPVRSPEKLSDIQNDDLTVVEQDLEEDFSAHFEFIKIIVGDFIFQNVNKIIQTSKTHHLNRF